MKHARSEDRLTVLSVVIMVTGMVAAFAFGWILKPAAPMPNPTPAEESGVDRTPAPTVRPKVRPPVINETVASGDAPSRPGPAARHSTDDAEKVMPDAEPALSTSQIDALTQAYTKSTNAGRRQLIRVRLLEGMTLENAARMKSVFDTVGDWSQRAQYFSRLGELGGFNLVDSDNSPDVLGHSRDWERGAALAGWAKVDLAGALAHWKTLAPGTDRHKHQSIGLAYGWAAADPQAATEFVLDAFPKRGPDQGEALGFIRLQVSLTDYAPDVMQKWMSALTTIGDDRARAGLTGAAVGKMAQTDPLQAAEWAMQQPEGTVSAFGIGEIARHMTQQDPDSAIQWTFSMDAGELERHSALRSLIDQLARQDPEGAISLVKATTEYVQGDLNHYDQAFEAWGKDDPVAAMTWADQNVPSNAHWEDTASAYFHAALPWARQDPNALGSYLNNQASDRAYGWGAFALSTALLESGEDPATAATWAAHIPHEGARNRLLARIQASMDSRPTPAE